MDANPALCEACKGIDFSQAASLDLQWSESETSHDGAGRFLASVGTAYRASAPTTCPLCPLLRSDLSETTRRAPADAAGPGDGVYIFPPSHMQRFHIGDGCLVPAGGAGISGVAVGPSRASCAQNFSPRTNLLAVHPSRLAGAFDASLPRRWLACCKEGHGCHVERMRPRYPITLVDCETGRLVRHDEEAPYVALSYVWGRPAAAAADVESRCRELPSTVPAVVGDAMFVAQKLGYQFLWVDRYCIDQEDRESVERQVNQMDSIYNCAEITIVAAAGESGDDGLSGPNGACLDRPGQAGIETAGAVLMQVQGEHPWSVIPQSKWMTRGWTFQEGLLSRRCLVFTEGWVYFECGEMACWNRPAILPPRRDPALSTSIASRGPEYTPSFFRFPISKRDRLDLTSREQTQRPILELFNLIEEYSQRDLSLDEDALRAFQGVFNRFKYLHHNQIDQLWGIPFIVSDPSSEREHLPGDQSYFIECLGWRPWRDATGTGHSQAPRRRRYFPSWSWAGWDGDCWAPFHPFADRSWSRAILHSLQDLKRDGARRPRSVLDLEAILIPPEDFDRGADGTLRLFPGSTVPFEVYRNGRCEDDLEELQRAELHACILLIKPEYRMCCGILLAKVPQAADPHRYHRVGHCDIYLPGEQQVSDWTENLKAVYSKWPYQRFTLE